VICQWHKDIVPGFLLRKKNVLFVAFGASRFARRRNSDCDSECRVTGDARSGILSVIFARKTLCLQVQMVLMAGFAFLSHRASSGFENRRHAGRGRKDTRNNRWL
jgi:hypothetical protein